MILKVDIARATHQIMLGTTELVAVHNAGLLVADPSIPRSYDSGGVYLLDQSDEPWFDLARMRQRGGGDCEDWVGWRVAEHRVLGSQAILPGDVGHAELRGRAFSTLDSRPVLIALPENNTHMVLEVKIDGVWLREDPAARLGMQAGVIDARIQERWKKLGVRQLAQPRWRV